MIENGDENEEALTLPYYELPSSTEKSYIVICDNDPSKSYKLYRVSDYINPETGRLEDIPIPSIVIQSESTRSVSTTSFSSFVIQGNEIGIVVGVQNLDWSDFVFSNKYYYHISETAVNQKITDAEKNSLIISPKDNKMCWAAACANVLFDAGWLIPSTKSEDDIFNCYRDSFLYGDTRGGNILFGLSWYLTGYYPPSYNSSLANLDQCIPNTGGYFLSVASYVENNLYITQSNNSPDYLIVAASWLYSYNASVCLSVSWRNSDNWNDTEGVGGHALTLKGFSFQNNNNEVNLTGVFVTDSDDDKYGSACLQPNVIKYIPVIWSSGYFYLDSSVYSNNGDIGRIEFTSLLLPASFTTLSSGGAVVSSAATLLGKTVESGYIMNVSSAGLAMDTTVTSGGIQTVLANGTALDTVVSSGGSMIISSGGTARFSSGGYADNIQASNGAILGLTVAPGTYLKGSYDLDQFEVSANSISSYTVHSGCKLDILLSGTANNIDVLAGGRLNVSSGGTVTGINAASGALLGIAVAPSTYVSGSYNNSSFNITSSVSNYAIHSGCSLDVLLSGTANNIDVLAGGGLNVSSGGSASSTTVSSGGTQSVFAKARSLITSVLSGGTMNVSSGGTATSTTVFSGGIANIFSGGTATNIHASSGARLGLTVAPGTYASGSYGSTTFEVSSASISNYTVHSGCALNVLSGGSTNNTTVHSNGIMNVSSGGTATGINAASGALLGLTVAPGTYASGSYGSTTFEVSSASISNYTVHSGCTLDVLSGGKVRGQMVFENGAIVSAAWGGFFAFDISNLSPNNTALMNNLSLIQGTPSYSITVSGTNAYGLYTLANGAPANYSGGMELYRGTDFLGTLSVGGTISNAYRLYSLNETNNILSLDIAEKPIKSDIDHTGKSDIILFNSSSNQVEYWKNGVTGGSLQLESGTLDSTTSMGIIGGYDMNSDYNADLVASSFVVSGGSTTMRIGYFSGGTVNVNASNFVSIGETEVSSMSFWELKVGNLTGTPDRNSIVFYSSSSYHLGAWKDGQEDWENISNTFGGDWKMLGCGDFNGDGKDSVLMSYLNGQNYWYADLNGSSGSMGIANWSGWEFGAVGDFAGDGKDDIVLYKKNGDAAGTVVLLKDGNLDDWSSIGTLDVRSWEIKGAGDYTGDCMDDLLVRNSSTGQLGCYLSADMNQWKNLATGSGIDANWTVIA